MRSSLNSSYLSALLSNTSNNANLSLQSPQIQALASLSGNSAGNNDLNASGIPRNSALLVQLLQQQQAEDQQRALLAQQLAAIGGLNYLSPQGGDPSSLAALLQLQQQQQQIQQQQRRFQELQDLQVALGFQGGNPLALLSATSLPSAGLTDATPLSTFGQRGQLDSVQLAKLVQQQQQQQQSQKGQQRQPSPPQHQSFNNAASPTVRAAEPENTAMHIPNMDRRRKGRTGTFPQKLHQMLSDLEMEEGGSDIASFLPHGRAFAIHKPRDFVKDVMPRYFRMSRFSSFQRQLNLYDFQRITEGCDKGAYFHDLFVQGRPVLCTMMKRNKIKGVKKNASTGNSVSKDEDSSHDNEDEDASIDSGDK